jgi:hypothetical protein
MAWKTLIGSAIQEDIARRKANPGVENFGTLVRTAMTLGIKQKEEVRQEAATGRTAARTALYSRYPQMAAQELGMDTSTLPSTAVTQPPGTALSKVTYDEYGNPQTTYESTAVGEKDLADMYNRIILEIDKTNALNSILPKYKAIPKPTFSQWKEERGFTTGLTTSMQTATDEELLGMLGISEEDINYTLQQHPEVTREQLLEALRANAQ